MKDAQHWNLKGSIVPIHVVISIELLKKHAIDVKKKVDNFPYKPLTRHWYPHVRFVATKMVGSVTWTFMGAEKGTLGQPAAFIFIGERREIIKEERMIQKRIA